MADDIANKTYPVIRVSQPGFLETRYGGSEGLFRRALDFVKPSGVETRLGDLSKRYPTLPLLFDADEQSLAMAIRTVISPSSPDFALQLARTIQRLLVFEDLPEVEWIIKTRLREVVLTFPRTLRQLEEGDSGRDVLDPFIVALGMRLLREDALEDFVRDLITHKCLMKLEGLVGHLHEEVLGRAAGKKRVAEPGGESDTGGRLNKQDWNADRNPYPGADARLDQVEFYQIKNKTGSAKGSDGEKLGRQFRILAEHYPSSRRFYVSLIGRTLAGHRSMGAFLRTDPEAEVLVGLTAFQQLGGHRDTPSIVLDLILDSFTIVKAEFNYDVDVIASRIATEWVAKHKGQDQAHALLRDMIVGPPDNQHSGGYRGRVRTPRIR